MPGKIVIKRFPEDYPTRSFLSCNDPANPSPFQDHALCLKQQGHCPACAKATYIQILADECWEFGLDKTGEIIVAYRGAAKSVIYILNYERYSSH